MNKSEEVLDFSQLPKTRGWLKSRSLFQYQGFWHMSDSLSNVIAFQHQFKAKDQDIISASNPKSGTTWLKALLFSILNRNRYTLSNTPLLTSNPQQLVPFFEFDIFSENPSHDLKTMSSPRLFATHIPYSSLHESIVDKHSKCKIVYICRNPLDFITSFTHFAKKVFHASVDEEEFVTIDEFIDKFCKGEYFCGPFWDHVLGFWKASLENPDKVLFLKYEDMLENTVSHVKRVAEFIGFPFSEEEAKEGVVEGIVDICSLSSLKGLYVNKHGKYVHNELQNNVFFRKGQVGDWKNHLTPSMVEKVKKVMEEKLCGSGLTFKYN